MALQLSPSSFSLEVYRSRAHRRRFRKLARVLFVLGGVVITSISATAQTPPQQQYVYASVPVSGTPGSAVVGFAKSQTGGLSSIGSPLNDSLEGGAIAIDAQGRFLFVLNPNSNNVSMLQINRTNGSLTEVSGSPFAVGFVENPNMRPSAPAYLTTEPSGQFLYVGYRNGNFSGKSAIIEYAIDPNAPRLVPTVRTAGSSDLPSPPLGMVADPKGQFLYVGMGPNPPLGIQVGTTDVYPIAAQLPSIPIGMAGGSESPPKSHRHRSTWAIFF